MPITARIDEPNEEISQETSATDIAHAEPKCVEYGGIESFAREQQIESVVQTEPPSPTPEPEIAEDDIIELARLITAESGYKNERLQRAVAQVVINRMNEYGMTLIEAIYQKNVFSPTSSRTYKNRDISDLAKETARWILSGNVHQETDESLYFCTVRHFEKHDGWHWRAYKAGTIKEDCRINGVIFFSGG